jgi:N-acetylglucosamine-6-sulfatase
MSRNGAAPVSYKGQYSPDITAQKAYGFLDEAMSHDAPWFVAVAPIAPHSLCVISQPEFYSNYTQYAPRHAHLFKDYKIPRTSNYNPIKVRTSKQATAEHF